MSCIFILLVASFLRSWWGSTVSVVGHLTDVKDAFEVEHGLSGFMSNLLLSTKYGFTTVLVDLLDGWFWSCSCAIEGGRGFSPWFHNECRLGWLSCDKLCFILLHGSSRANKNPEVEHINLLLNNVQNQCVFSRWLPGA